jgi:hypothetical protein
MNRNAHPTKAGPGRRHGQGVKHGKSPVLADKPRRGVSQAKKRIKLRRRGARAAA